MRKLQLKLLDYLIFGALLLAGLAGLWGNLRAESAGRQQYVLVYVENRLVAELSLSANDCFTYEIPFGEGGRHRAVLEVEGGRVRMLPLNESLCPRGICAHTGWISRPYESIVCLPNRIMVVFSPAATDRDGGIDGMTF